MEPPPFSHPGDFPEALSLVIKEQNSSKWQKILPHKAHKAQRRA
jgi:hypothetical protein